MEAVACQRILAAQDLDPTYFRHGDDGASHPAVRARAAADRIEAVAQRRLETHRTAMALAGLNVRIACHVACVSYQFTRTPGPWSGGERLPTTVLATSTGSKPAVQATQQTTTGVIRTRATIMIVTSMTKVALEFEPDNSKKHGSDVRKIHTKGRCKLWRCHEPGDVARRCGMRLRLGIGRTEPVLGLMESSL
jgi:hypothetical protein